MKDHIALVLAVSAEFNLWVAIHQIKYTVSS